MGLRDIGESLPPGFRFYPNDEELVCHYLSKKIANEQILKGTLVEIDLHAIEPWQLPEVAKLNSSEWYFFSFRDRKYATGYRANRATRSGYWKATGKDRTIRDPKTRKVVGMRKTLVFYQHRAPNGTKTGWIMHEFRLENPHVPPKEDWVLCRVFHKSPSKLESNKYDILSPQSTLCCAAANNCPITSPPVDQTFPSGIPETPPNHQTLNPSTPLIFLDPNPSFPAGEVSSKKCEDEYGFLFDLGLNETYDLLNSVPSGYGEMKFDDEESSLVFL